MDFSLSDEQQMIRNMCREFAEEEIKPHAEEMDRSGAFPYEIVFPPHCCDSGYLFRCECSRRGSLLAHSEGVVSRDWPHNVRRRSQRERRTTEYVLGEETDTG